MMDTISAAEPAGGGARVEDGVNGGDVETTDVDGEKTKPNSRKRINRMKRFKHLKYNSFAIKFLLKPPEKRSNPILLIPFSSELFPTSYMSRIPEWSSRAGHSVTSTHWRHWGEFLLVAIASVAGQSNVGHLPKLAVENGQGTFIAAFIIVMFLLGFPLLFLELVVGQFTARDPFRLFALLPIARGLGFSFLILCGLTVMLLNVRLSWLLYFLYQVLAGLRFGSFPNWPLPWEFDCKSMSLTDRSVDLCRRILLIVGNNSEFICTAQFFHKVMAEDKSDCLLASHEDGLTAAWPLVGALLFGSGITLLIVWNGIKTAGWYVVLVLPLSGIALVMLMSSVVFLEGAVDGLTYILTPNWSYASSVKMWCLAVTSVLGSLNLDTGAMILIGSYASFKSPAHLSAFYICLVEVMVCLMIACLTACSIGIASKYFNVGVSQLFDMLILDDPLFCFTYAAIMMKRMWLPSLWIILLFAIFIWLKETCKVTMLLVFLRPIYEHYPTLNRTKYIANLFVLVISFVFAMPLLQEAWVGKYTRELVRHGPVLWLSPFVVAIFVSVFIYGYGIIRLRQDIHYMMNYLPNIYFSAVWILTPPLVMILMIYDLTTFDWSGDVGISCSVFVLIVLPIPIGALGNLIAYKKKGMVNMLLYPSDLPRWPRSHTFSSAQLHRNLALMGVAGKRPSGRRVSFRESSTDHEGDSSLSVTNNTVSNSPVVSSSATSFSYPSTSPPDPMSISLTTLSSGGTISSPESRETLISPERTNEIAGRSPLAVDRRSGLALDYRSANSSSREAPGAAYTQREAAADQVGAGSRNRPSVSDDAVGYTSSARSRRRIRTNEAETGRRWSTILPFKPVLTRISSRSIADPSNSSVLNLPSIKPVDKNQD